MQIISTATTAGSVYRMGETSFYAVRDSGEAATFSMWSFEAPALSVAMQARWDGAWQASTDPRGWVREGAEARLRSIRRFVRRGMRAKALEAAIDFAEG